MCVRFVKFHNVLNFSKQEKSPK